MNEERDVAAQFFQVTGLRSHIPERSIVIGRYSVLPFFRELELDLQRFGSRLLNPYREHNWIAGFIDYYEALKDYTPRSWTESEYPYCGYDGPVVVKGRTNSRKRRWGGKGGMFAANRKEAIELIGDLSQDPLIGPQGLVVREYVPLVTYEHDPISGLPITNEHRFFFHKTTLLCHGYYWVTASDETQKQAHVTQETLDLAHKLAAIAAENVTGFVLDLAEKQSGGWMLVEMNDLQMSGLSACKAEDFYGNLKKALEVDGHA